MKLSKIYNMAGISTAAAIGIGLAGVGMMKSAQAQNKATRASSRMSAQALAFQREQQAKLDAQKEIYRKFEFTNPYEDMTNAYANLTNPYANMQNVYEDLTVNQQQAQFMAQQSAQQRADILGGLRGAAGASGIAGLAQSLANQQQLQAQAQSGIIGQQEMAIQSARARGAATNQLAERKGQAALDLTKAKGASAADMAERGGAAMLQEAEMSRQSTLLGVEYSGMAGANAGVQQAYANQMQTNAMAAQMTADRWNTASGIAMGFAGGQYK